MRENQENQKYYEKLEEYQHVINAIVAVFTCIGVVGAIWFSVIQQYFTMKEPDVQISQYRHYSEGGKHEVVFYNGGDAPCLDFIIQYPESAEPLSIIHNYAESSLSEVKVRYEKGKQIFYVPSRPRQPYKGDCKDGTCLHKAGVLLPEALYAVQFGGTIRGDVVARCVNFKTSIVLAR